MTKKAKPLTLMKRDSQAFHKAQAIKRKWIEAGYVDAYVEERKDRYIVMPHLPKDKSRLSEAERVRRSGR